MKRDNISQEKTAINKRANESSDVNPWIKQIVRRY